MTVVGQCIGAKRKDEAIYYIKRLSWLSEIVILISCAVVYLLAKPVTILGRHGNRKRPPLPADGRIYYHHQTDFVGAFLYSRLRHARSRRCKIFHDYLLRQHVAVRVSLCIFLCRFCGFGPIAVWIGMFADWSVRAVVFMLRFHSRKWLQHHVID